MHYINEDLLFFEDWIQLQVDICMAAIDFWLASEELV
jgi:hypothetical protein